MEEKTHPTKSSIPNSGTGVGHESTAHHSEIFEDGIGECPILDISPKNTDGTKSNREVTKWHIPDGKEKENDGECGLYGFHRFPG